MKSKIYMNFRNEVFEDITSKRYEICEETQKLK